jgi:cytochrome c biogenesis protein CcdA
MEFGPGTYGLGVLAGLLSTLSPCVLPLIPITVGSAVAAHRRGPLALAAGLTLSFALMGTLIAYAGTSIGLGPETIRKTGAVLLGVFGLLLLFSALQRPYARATASLSAAGQSLLTRLPTDGLFGQFGVGLVLGVIWSPCVGPTLGAAIGLASQGRDLGPISLLMFLFGVGASAPLLILGLLGHSALTRMKTSLLRVGHLGKMVLGAVFLIMAIGIVSGADRQLESWLVDHSPAWLTGLTTRY